MQIGIAGTGKMGTAIAQRLLEVGHEVTAWALTTERMYVLQSINCGSINGTFRDARTLGTVGNCLVYRAAISLITLINQQLCIQYLGI